MWAVTTWSFCSFTRKVVLGRVSTTSPSIWIASSFAIETCRCSGNRADCDAGALPAQLIVSPAPHAVPAGHQLSEFCLEPGAGQVAAAQPRQVRARHLAIDQRNVESPALLDQPGQRDFRRVG